MDAGLDDLFQNISGLIGIKGESSINYIDGTYEIEADNFTLTFVVDSFFEIRNIDIRNNSGLGRQIILIIHEYADENDFDVIASNVKDVARNFWEKLRYQEGENEDEFFRVA